MCKTNDAAATITAHAAFGSVGIEINHSEIVFRIVLQQNESISANPKPTVTQPFNESLIGSGENAIPIIDHDKIIPCTLVFEKIHCVVVSRLCLMTESQVKFLFAT